MPKGSRNRNGRPISFAAGAALIGIGFGALLTVGFLVERSEEAARAAAQEQERQRASLQTLVDARWAILFRSDSLDFLSSTCHSAALDTIGYAAPVAALAVATDAVDFYFRTRGDERKLRHIRCTAEGLRDQEVAHPLLSRFPSEAEVSAEDEGQVRPDTNPWSELGRWLLWPDPRLQSVELASDPRDGRLLQRWLQQRPDGLQLRRLPPDSGDFAVLTSSRHARDLQATVPTERPEIQWNRAVPQALALLAQELPADIHLSFVRVEAGLIEIGVPGPRPDLGLKGMDPGGLELDAFGDSRRGLRPSYQPDRCAQGLPLEQVRALFETACASQRGCKPETAFELARFACADGKPAGWSLRAQAIP